MKPWPSKATRSSGSLGIISSGSEFGVRSLGQFGGRSSRFEVWFSSGSEFEVRGLVHGSMFEVWLWFGVRRTYFSSDGDWVRAERRTPNQTPNSEPDPEPTNPEPRTSCKSDRLTSPCHVIPAER